MRIPFMGGGCVSASRTSIRLGAGRGRRPFDGRARFWAIAGTDGALLYRRRSCIRSVAVAHPGEAEAPNAIDCRDLAVGSRCCL
jgi:hypothetical protein